MYIETSWGKRGVREGIWGRGGRGRRKREKFLTIVNISKKKYMPKNAYFIPSNICRRVVLFPPFPFPPPPLPPTPLDDDPAKIFSQAISQQGYHFNNRKYLLPDDDIHIISFSCLFFLFFITNTKRKKKSHRAQQNRDISPLSLSLYSLLVVLMVMVMVIYLHTQSQFSS